MSKPRSYEVYADHEIGGCRESDQEPDNAVYYADLDEARRVFRARLSHARKIKRERDAGWPYDHDKGNAQRGEEHWPA